MMPDYPEIKAELLEIAGILERYPEALQLKVFDTLMRYYLGEPGNDEVPVYEQPEPPVVDSSKGSEGDNDKKTTKKKRSATKEVPKLLKDLELRGNGSISSFKDFATEKKPKSNVEFNTVAIYYLEEIVELKGIGPDHVYTCYREAGRRPPEAFQQSLWDTGSSKYGYINTSNLNDLKVSYRGKVFVEHDLPKAAKKA